MDYYESARETVKVIGDCSRDLAVCEIFRAAVANELVPAPDNITGQAMRTALAEKACHTCRVSYLNDVELK